jgi:hypothetical protein
MSLDVAALKAHLKEAFLANIPAPTAEQDAAVDSLAEHMAIAVDAFVGGTGTGTGGGGASWYSGAGAPAPTTGSSGDYYLDTASGDVYAKTTGWGTVGNIRGPIGATGATGATGADGANGSTWYSGSAGPAGGAGIDGDYYYRTATGDIYKKVSGTWGTIGNITGPTGAAGAAGTNGTNGTNGATWYSGSAAPAGGTGVDGDFYFRTATGDVYKKAAGTWSTIANIIGPPGATGATGAAGTNGTNGTNGSTWYSGSTVPAGGTGVDGDYYFRTGTGDIYKKASGSWSTIANITGPAGTGGGGTPGGAAKQVQFNNAGSFDGASEVLIDTDDRLVLNSTTNTAAAPAAGGVKPYSSNRTGVDELRVSQGLGGDFPLQAGLGHKITGMVFPGVNAFAAYNMWTASFIGSVGTGLTVNKAYDASNMQPNFTVLKYTSTAATNVAAELYMNNNGRAALVGNNAIGGGGAKLVINFCLPTYASTQRIYMGYITSSGAITLTTDPSTVVNAVGIGKGTADSTFQIYNNDSSGAATVTNTGIAPNANDIYRATIYFPSNSNVFFVTLEAFSKSSVTVFNSGGIATNIPAAGTLLNMHTAVGTAGVATAVTLGIISIYEEQY